MAKEDVYKTIAEVCETEKEALLKKQNVVGVAIGNKIKEDKDIGKPCIMLFVSHKVDKDELISNSVN